MCWVTGLCVGLVVAVVISSPTGRHTSRKHQLLHSSQVEFARRLANYEIVIPHRLTADGEFVSHAVHHSRPKRDVSSIHYRLPLTSGDLDLDLRPNHHLLSPGFTVEYRPRGYRKVSQARIKQWNHDQMCLFSGSVRGHNGSKVAVGTCNGLRGFVHTRHGQLFIEPVKGYNYTQGGEHPHLVYSRTALPADLDSTPRQINKTDNATGSCGVDESYEASIREREQWEKERQLENGRQSADQGESPDRHKRSISLERFVETLVVVDREMMEFYKNEDITTYVLTIMNMVSVLYHDASVGNAVNVALVNLMLMDYDEEELKITHHADNTLKSFCRWQKSININNDKEANHHDVAILLTRRNICSRMNEPCSTLGLSQVNGLCQPHRSCNINEDTGLSLAFTVAHELGHNFGMQHDDSSNGCEPVAGQYQLVMAAQLNAESAPMIWSRCSRDSITVFLDRGWGYCLDDAPAAHELPLDERPPGIKYDANHQCRLQYGEDAQYCQGIDNLCTTLWCKLDNKCMTRLEAAAEGTICEEHMWCSGGRCVPLGETPLATNGEWGEWSSWSQCSRSCGAGVSYRERHCDNPPPKSGGQYCVGERKRYSICRTDPCPDNGPDFKDLQCTEFNPTPYKGKLYEWEYVANPRTPCQLHCRPKDQFFSVMLKDIVRDGTSCSIQNQKGLCISGLCRKVGCDWEIDSEAREDDCGVCRGDSSTCQTITEHYDKESGLGYEEATVIPAGARNIRIEEVAEANNYLAVRNDKGEYYLNGGWYIQWNGDYEVAGTVMTYARIGDKEILTAPGPLKEPLHIMLLFQSENPGVQLEYTIPNKDANDTRKHEYRWMYMEWTHCTHSCGGGTQRSQVVCHDVDRGLVDDHACNSSSRPDDMIKTCNEHVCPPRWWSGPWQHCSVTCGVDGIRRRTVLCIRSSGADVQEALEDRQCEGQEKPIDTSACGQKPDCPEGSAQWVTGHWTQCSVTCGGGLQVRKVTCPTADQSCDVNTKPVAETECQMDACSSTSLDRSHSSATDRVNKTMRVFEDNFDKPNVVIPALDHDLPTTPTAALNEVKELSWWDWWHGPTTTRQPEQFTWVTLNWDKCSLPCGGGVRRGTVNCFNVLTYEEVGEENCVSVSKPNSVETCNTDPCMNWTVGHWKQCSVGCGVGVETRTVQCPQPNKCDPSQRPSDSQACVVRPCHDWSVPEQWSECSVSCGDGFQQRPVVCQHTVTHEPAHHCDEQTKPAHRKKCHQQPCVQPNEGVGKPLASGCQGDQLSPQVCQALSKLGRCWHQLVADKCCLTCQR